MDVSRQSNQSRQSQFDEAEAWLQQNDPSYLASRQGWKQLTGRGTYVRPQEESPEATADDVVLLGALDQRDPDGHYDPDREIEYQREYDRIRDQQPHRKRDRHKSSRARYMREYRARKRAS